MDPPLLRGWTFQDDSLPIVIVTYLMLVNNAQCSRIWATYNFIEFVSVLQIINIKDSITSIQLSKK